MNNLGDLIAIGRKVRGLTQAELGGIVGVTQVAINRYESGDREPDDEMVRALADALGVSERLLRHGDRFRGALAVDAHMRRQKSTKASIWRRVEADLNLLRVHSSLLFEEVSLRSEQSVPTFDPEYTSPEDAARFVRAQWRMPIGPVVNLVRWMEAAGCLIFEEDFGTHRIDGMSQWVGDHPVILLNLVTTPDRRRLTLAHELGHLTLHSNDVHENAEEQANEFAAELLMPETAIRIELRRRDLGTLLDIKREWGVSMQAIFERAYRLRVATAPERTAFYKAMNTRGWKTKEPGAEAIPLERPQLARSIGDTLRSKGFSDADIDALAGYSAGGNNPFRPVGRRLQIV
ncbi:MAG: helix-turn-helix domain-containing protein [Acidimicrobiales bacterium]|jgi:Zn-dependent peptidase ImmA (M78 family)/DNA-binding XRE family transcriptional regulator